MLIRLAKSAETFIEEGGKIVTAWPPITFKNRAEWVKLAELRRSHDLLSRDWIEWTRSSLPLAIG